MRWVQSAPGDFAGTPPSPRSGHTAVKVGKSLVVVFGGLVDKRFLNDLIVYDIDNKAWFQPNCVGSGNDGEPIGPSPRAFHVAVAIDCNMFIFGGRSGRKRLGDFWMLDTDIWQWAELSSYGDLPPARDFAAGASVGNGKLVLYGGWDGSKWLSDVYVLDTISLEWRQLPVIGPSPAPRCGHTATMVEKRLLIFGGRGGGGPIMGDLWALKGLFDEEKESPAWTQLKLSGQAPAPRCGHTISSGGTQLLVFGGHGTGGWLTRYDIYYNDCVILDRASVQWKRLPLNSEPPPPRAYHSITRVGVRFFLIGGYDGKSTFGDLWWLVSEDDPIAKRALSSTQSHVDVNQPSVEEQSQASTRQIASRDIKIIEQGQLSPLAELRRRLGLPSAAMTPELSELSTSTGLLDKELISLASTFVPERHSFYEDPSFLIQAVRNHWRQCDARSIRLHELGPLFKDYRRIIADIHRLELTSLHSTAIISATPVHRFYHLKNANQLRMDDIPVLLTEYKQLLHLYNSNSPQL